MAPGLGTLPLGQGEIRRHGKNIAILNFGTLLPEALAAAEALDATVADMRFVKPLDGALITDLVARHGRLVTLEDNAVAGGAGSAVGEYLAAQGIGIPLLQLGIPDRFLGHGGREALLAACGLDAAGIRAAIAAGDCANTRSRLIS